MELREPASDGSGTYFATEPPNAAISRTPRDERKLYSGEAIRYIVSISGAIPRFRLFIWNSHSKSDTARRPFTIERAPRWRANSTTSVANPSTLTFGMPPRDSSMKAILSSRVNIVRLC